MNTKKTKKQAPPGGIRHSASLWVLFLLACGFMFFSGVLVGRNTMPVRFDMADLNEKLGRLQKSVLTEEALIEETAKPLEQIPFEFYEKLRDDDLYALSDEEEMPLRLIKPKFEKKPPPSARVAEVAPQPRENRIEASASADLSRRGFVIQVASLRDEKSAAAVRDKFRSRGYPAYTQMAVVEGRGQWLRVRIGPYPDREQASDDLVRLQQAGVDAILLRADEQ